MKNELKTILSDLTLTPMTVLIIGLSVVLAMKTDSLLLNVLRMDGYSATQVVVDFTLMKFVENEETHQ